MRCLLPFNDLRNTLRIPIKDYTETPTKLGDKIRNRRIELKLTIQQLAELLKVTEEVVAYREYNRGKPKVYNYLKLIEVLGFLPFEIDKSTLGGKIIAYRYTKGLSRKKFSKMLRVDESTIKTWEDNTYSSIPHNMKVLQSLLSKFNN